MMRLLVDAGNKLGYETFVAVNDKGRRAGGGSLGDLATQKSMPEKWRGQKGINDVDVIWFEGTHPTHMFEVEIHGGMHKALDRLNECTSIRTKFFVIGTAENRKQFDSKLAYAVFDKTRGMFRFRTTDELEEFYSATVGYSKARTGFEDGPAARAGPGKDPKKRTKKGARKEKIPDHDAGGLIPLPALRDIACPRCGSDNKDPVKEWMYGANTARQFSCRCGKIFVHFISRNGKMWTNPKPGN